VFEHGHHVGDRRAVQEVEAGADQRRAQRGQLHLQRRPDGGGEPGRRLDDHVDHERPAAEAHLGPLPVEIGDRLADLADRAVPDAAAPVQHPVHGRLAETGLAAISRIRYGCFTPYNMRGF
jgi:hypothetical protein